VSNGTGDPTRRGSRDTSISAVVNICSIRGTFVAKRNEPHHRPTPEQLDEKISLKNDDPEAVIEALMRVDPDGPEADEKSEKD
jgi:hypothetical protein